MEAKKTKNKRGFTLIEVMVSVSIFAIIMTVGMGALVDLTKSYKESQAKKSLVDKINFAMEGMVREIRTGENYNNSLSFVGNVRVPQPGTPGSSSTPSDHIGFDASAGRGYFMYYIPRGADNSLYRRVYLGGDMREELLLGGDDISITSFSVITNGVYPKVGSGSTDDTQARVTIKIQAESPTDEDISVTIQTGATQRSLDQ